MRTLLLVTLIAWIGAQFSSASAALSAASPAPSHGFTTCEALQIQSPTNALDMAELMGTNHIFNVSLLSKYEDEAKFIAGEVVIVTAEDRYPEAMQPFEKKGDTYFYQFQRRHEIMAIRFTNKQFDDRQLAENNMKIYEVDRCALKKY